VRADRDHHRIIAEQRQPGVREDRGREPDRLGEPACDRGADPGDAHRALAPARADRGADHGGERRAEAEHQRHQQIFEPCAGAVAGDGGGAEDAGQAGRGRDAHIGGDAHQRGHRADAQDLARRRPGERRRPR